MELPTYYILWSYLHIHTFIYYYIHFKTSRASIITFASWNPILYFALSNLHRLIVHSQVVQTRYKNIQQSHHIFR